MRREIPTRSRIVIAALACSAALLFGSPLVHGQGQGTGPLPGSIPGTYGPPFVQKGGKTAFGGGAAPVLSACGTGAAMADNATDSAFSFTVGTSASNACTITPSSPYTAAPNCVVDTAGATKPSVAIAVSGVISLTGTVADSARYTVLCFGKPGSF